MFFRSIRRLAALLCLPVLLAGLTACSDPGAESGADTTDPAGASEQPADVDARADAFFERVFEESLDLSPMYKTYLGIRDEDYGRWNDLSEEQAEAELAMARRHLEELKQFDPEQLSPDTRLSWRLMRRDLEDTIEGHEWRHHGYPLNQMFGWQSRIPTFLINVHRVDSVEHAEAYIDRLQGVDTLAGQLVARIDRRADEKVIAPDFVWDYVISDARNVISGAPFEDGEPSPLLADIREKFGALEIPEAERKALIGRAEEALVEVVEPAYRRLITRSEDMDEIARSRAGVWKLPEGESYYDWRLRQMTTTDLSAEEIHRIGLENVERIHEQMRGIMEQVGFDGSLQEFFEYTRTDDRFYLPDTEEGRQAYLEDAREYIAGMRGTLPEVFGRLPRAELVVKAVEPFRERSAGKAFYQRPAPDGSRPGVFYANLHRMEDMPTYQLEALVYHEAIPGHHMQLSIAQELEDLPRFRKYGGQTAYTEGWGLYSERLPKELGFYEDPYSDFGRLAMELWRACRLVVDTGIHEMRWTREQAIDYLLKNTPNPEGDSIKAIERYIVMPGQATAYMVGMLKILEIRETAKEALGEEFDLRDFHDAVLENGALPLDVLEVTVLEKLGVR
jgi:uncharacterized protein (DUF885 family)